MAANVLSGKLMWPVIRDLFGLGHLERVRECKVTVPVVGLVTIEVDFFAAIDGEPEPPQRRFVVQELA